MKLTPPDDVRRRGEHGPCEVPDCGAEGPKAGPYTTWHSVLVCWNHLGELRATEDVYPVDPDLTQQVEAEIHRLELADVTEQSEPGMVEWIDWNAAWTKDRNEADWLIEPVIPRGRETVIYAPAGEGKSEMALWVALTAVRNGLTVIYLDLEQIEDDLMDRLVDFGCGPADDLSRLHYTMFPNLDPLDTRAGGDLLREVAAYHDADLVIFDTMGRVVEGPENDTDTYRAFHRHTGILLRADGRAVLRLDHEGKDPTKGQRGASGKNEDVDLVWHLSRRDGGVRLTLKKRRSSWIPQRVDLARITEPDLDYKVVDETWSERTREIAAYLDKVNVPLDAGRPTARKALADIGVQARNDTLGDALRYRRQATLILPHHVGDSVGDSANASRGQSTGTASQEPLQHKAGTGAGTGGDSTPAVIVGGPLSLRGQGPPHGESEEREAEADAVDLDDLIARAAAGDTAAVMEVDRLLNTERGDP